MVMMPSLAAFTCSSSTLILTTFTASSRSLARSLRIGAIARQGPHHGAQKSTSTSLSDFTTSLSNWASVISWHLDIRHLRRGYYLQVTSGILARLCDFCQTGPPLECGLRSAAGP